MNQWSVVRLVIALYCVLAARHVRAEELPSPIALLRGVEQVRTQYDSVRATLEVRYLAPPPAPTIDCLVEMDGPKLRFEFQVLEGDQAGQVVLRDGEVFQGYRRKKHEDVEIYDIDRAAGVRGDIAFDPRILGLSDLMSCRNTVRSCLWYEKADILEVVGQEPLHDIEAWRVRVRRGDDTMELWIEEPLFRVHRQTIDTLYMYSRIDSTYESARDQSPFPSEVTTQRKYKLDRLQHRNEERIYRISTFEAGVPISPERFTLASMDLPINTMINDYRISRIVGYWDGEGISEHPVRSPQAAASTPPQPPVPPPAAAQSPMRLWLIIVNVVVLAGLISFVLWRRRGAA